MMNLSIFRFFFLVLCLQSLVVIEGNEINYSIPQGYYENCSDKIDPQTAQLLSKINQSPPAFRKIPIDELKQIPKEVGLEPSVHTNIESIENICIEGPHGPLGLRIYKPKSSAPLPVFIFFHGGGWTAGSLSYYDDFCQEICQQSKCLLIAVDYGQAPQSTYPEPLEECYFAVNWIEEHISEKGGDPTRIAIGGDSAGGNLTAAITLKAREYQKPNFVCQFLICPALNYNFDTLSYYEFSEGYFINREDMKFFWNNYLANYRGENNPSISPLLADSLSRLPPAFLLIANFDPLRDEGLAYGLRLHREGVPTQIKRFNSIHGFYGFNELDVRKEAIAFIAIQLSEQLKAVNQ